MSSFCCLTLKVCASAVFQRYELVLVALRSFVGSGVFLSPYRSIDSSAAGNMDCATLVLVTQQNCQGFTLNCSSA